MMRQDRAVKRAVMQKEERTLAGSPSGMLGSRADPTSPELGSNSLYSN